MQTKKFENFSGKEKTGKDHLNKEMSLNSRFALWRHTIRKKIYHILIIETSNNKINERARQRKFNDFTQETHDVDGRN